MVLEKKLLKKIVSLVYCHMFMEITWVVEQQWPLKYAYFLISGTLCIQREITLQL